MVCKIRNVEELASIPIADEETKETLYHFAKVFTYEYGGNINCEGGYVLFVKPDSDVEEIKNHFDYTQKVLEFGYISDNVCYAVYVVSDDYSIVIVSSKEDMPCEILAEIERMDE